jgi:hypothetical protein
VDEAELTEVTAEQEMTTCLLDIEHQAARVVRGFRMPALEPVEHAETRSGLGPRRRRGERPHHHSLSTHLVERQPGGGILLGRIREGWPG